MRSLYVHVPFCAHKCEYCAFYSAPPKGGQIDRFVDALVREMALVAPRCRPETVFFGGGTPSILTMAQWRVVLEGMARLNLLGAAEWTVECNPATVSEDKAKLLREFGVNRISMGVQSLDEGLLERLGRVHTRDMVFRSYETLRKAGFDNVNIDLMFAIPGQTRALWNETLREAVALGSEHLSCYEVIYEEDTPLYAQLKAREFDVDEDLACAMYEDLIEAASAAGYHQYEVANFGRASRAGESPRTFVEDLPFHACRHNVAYWRGADFFGLGPSASEYVGGERSKNASNTDMYCSGLEQGRRTKEFRERLAPEQRAGELAAFGLRMTAGWPFELFRQRTGFDLRTGWRGELDRALSRGWAAEDGERVRLTKEGLRFADAVAEMMLR